MQLEQELVPSTYERNHHHSGNVCESPSVTRASAWSGHFDDIASETPPATPRLPTPPSLHDQRVLSQTQGADNDLEEIAMAKEAGTPNNPKNFRDVCEGVTNAIGNAARKSSGTAVESEIWGLQRELEASPKKCQDLELKVQGFKLKLVRADAKLVASGRAMTAKGLAREQREWDNE